jgi:hypothetical protein
MEVGDFIEDTYKSFNGEIIAILRGVVTEVSEGINIKSVKYHCSQIHYSDTTGIDTMLGKIVSRNARTCTVLSKRGGIVEQSGSEWEKDDLVKV